MASGLSRAQVTNLAFSVSTSLLEDQGFRQAVLAMVLRSMGHLLTRLGNRINPSASALTYIRIP